MPSNHTIYFGLNDEELLNIITKEADADDRSIGWVLKSAAKKHYANHDIRHKAFTEGAISVVRACNDAQKIMDGE